MIKLELLMTTVASDVPPVALPALYAEALAFALADAVKITPTRVGGDILNRKS